MTARCPLTDPQAAKIVEALPRRFNTLDFICACPYSGGDRDASECGAVAARGSRSICGRRLSAYQQLDSGALQKDNTVSPARWTRQGPGAQSLGEETWAEKLLRAIPPVKRAQRGTESPRPTRGSGGRSSWDAAMRQHQIRWKVDVCGVCETGKHRGEDRDYLFPEDLWFANLLPAYRVEATRALSRHEISRHQFTHHVMSSQVFALNLAAPFFAEPGLLTTVIGAVIPALRGLVAEVLRIEPEYDGDTNYFNEPGARGTNRTSSDLAVWWRDHDGDENLVLIEVKFSEREFGGCSKGHQVGTCTTDGKALLATCGAGCPLVDEPHQRTYWDLIRQTELFNGAVQDTVGCPFYNDGYQLMRNQLLAAVIEQDATRPEKRVDFAVLYHDGNPDILHPSGFPGAKRGLEAWPDLLTDPGRFHVIPASDWVGAAPAELAEWSTEFEQRYFPGRSDD